MDKTTLGNGAILGIRRVLPIFDMIPVLNRQQAVRTSDYEPVSSASKFSMLCLTLDQIQLAGDCVLPELSAL